MALDLAFQAGETRSGKGLCLRQNSSLPPSGVPSISDAPAKVVKKMQTKDLVGK